MSHVMTCFGAAAPSLVSPNLVYGFYQQPSLCILFQVCALSCCLHCCNYYLGCIYMYVTAAGTLGMVQHVFLTHCLVAVMAANHLHCFLLCSYVCCHSTSCIIPSDTSFQFRQLQCPLCLPFSVFINTAQREPPSSCRYCF
jgi:hypothetical protein